MNCRKLFVYMSMMLCMALADSGSLLGANSACPAGPRQVETFMDPNSDLEVVASTPETRTLCHQGCCEEIILSVPDGWSADGQVTLFQVFTTACENGDCKPNDVLATITGPWEEEDGEIKIQVCYPKTHEQKSFETHTDLSITIYDAPGGAAGGGSQIPWVGVDQTNAAGVIGPSQDWDIFCCTVGCTPGYWKNHTEDWMGVDPDDSFFSVFGKFPSFDAGLTMLEGTETGGGGEKAMVRHCSAAYVGSKWLEATGLPDENGGVCGCFGLGAGSVPPSDIIANVQAAYNGVKSFGDAHQFCAQINESICPFNGVWMNTDNGQKSQECGGSGVPCNTTLDDGPQNIPQSNRARASTK